MRKIPKHLMFLTMGVFVAALLAGTTGYSSTLVPQTWLPGDTLFPNIAFQAPMHVFGPGYNKTLPRVDATKYPNLKVTLKEVDHPSLLGYNPTRVWAYEITDVRTGKLLGPAHWPGVTIENQRLKATKVTYVNELPSFDPANSTSGYPYSLGLVQGLVSVDQSIHWADPLANTGPMNCMGIDCTVQANSTNLCCQVFTGPIPAVTHLHGAEAFSGVDGGPEQWFTPDGVRGKDYFSYGNPNPNEAIYKYQNLQEPGILWFHDHALGATRTNVYGGLAAFYFIRDNFNTPKNLPKGAYEIELAIQDRQFDTNAQLFFPDGSDPNCGTATAADPCLNGPPPNPSIHPYWNPEFFGDVAIVNGDAWPVLQVEPRRYMFILLDGSNARFYRMTFGDAAAGEPNPPVYVMGNDDGYLDKAVNVTNRTMATVGEVVPDGTIVPAQVFIGPGERNYVIVDFAGLALGTTVTVMNNAPAPFPGGTLIPGVAPQVGMAKIMQFKVSIPLKSKDTSCNPALGQCKDATCLNKMVRLADGNGNVAPGTKISKVRQLILKEHQGPGGPIEVLVNNTHWDGLSSPGIKAVFPTEGISELPRVGSTELWEIINLTMDAHPMHTHLTQFQVLNRQDYNPQYNTDWEASFGNAAAPAPLPMGCTAGTFCAGYGPPFAYNVPNADGAIGGNLPLVNGTTNYLINPVTTTAYPAVAPNPEESGWKDTAKAFPGKVTRLLVRWTPTSIPNWLTKPGWSWYSFDPTAGPGYVWHCHIIDHEDNEMMRPYKVTW